MSFDYNMQTVPLTADLVIPAGKTVRVGPGVIFNAAAKVTVQVQGTLVVTGTAASPTKFQGTATGPNSWNGIVIASGGDLEMQYGNVDGATYGIHALPGSTYNIDHATLGTSFKTAVLESNGKIDHTHFLATAPPTISLAEDVSIDDPNGTLTILSASPTLTNSEFVGASPLTDLVRIGGSSTPMFDHDVFKNAHCGFHTYGGTNSSPQINNSVISGMSYGVMAFTTKPIFKGDVFQGNTDDAGFCYGAAAANAPVFDGSYFASGTAAFDASCVQVSTAATNSVTAMIAGAGPVGL
jgi:hypothetical protein